MNIGLSPPEFLFPSQSIVGEGETLETWRMRESGRLGFGQDVHFQGHRSPGRSQAGTSSVRVIERRRGVAILSPRIKTGFRRVSRLVMIATYRICTCATCQTSCSFLRRPTQLKQQEAFRGVRIASGLSRFEIIMISSRSVGA